MAGLNLSPLAGAALGNAVASAPGLALQQQQEQAKTQVMQGQAATSQMQVGGEQAYNKLMADQMKGYQPSGDQLADTDSQIKAMQQTIPQLAGQGFGQKAQDLSKQVQALQQQKLQLGLTGVGKAALQSDTEKMKDIGIRSGALPPTTDKVELVEGKTPDQDNFVAIDKDGNVVAGMGRLAAEHMGYTNDELANMENKRVMAEYMYKGRQYTADQGLQGKQYSADSGLEGKKYAADIGLAKADLTGEYSLSKERIAAAAKKAQGSVEQSKIPDGVTGREALQYIPEERRATTWAIIEGRMPPLSGFVLKTPYGQSTMEDVNRVDPGWSAQRAQIRQAFTTGKDGQNRAALNTAALHSGAYAEAMQALQNGDFVPGNEIYNKISTALGHPAPTTAAAIRAASAGEKATALKGIATDTEIDHILGTMKEGASTEQSIAGEKAFLGIAHQKLQTYQDRYNEKIPDDTTWDAVLPSAKAVFDKYGFSGMNRPQAQAPQRQQSQPQKSTTASTDNVLGPAPTGAKEGQTGKYGGKPFKIVNGQMVIQG